MVISGGRDKCVFRTNLTNRASELLFVEDDPIHDIVTTFSVEPNVAKIRGGHSQALWVATASSDVKKWTIPSGFSGDYGRWPAMETPNRAVPGRAFLIAGTSSRRSLDTSMNLKPLQIHPEQIIQGLSPIVDHIVLNDQRRILTKERSNDVALWDATTGSEIERYGNVDFRHKAEELYQYLSVPRWFSVGPYSHSSHSKSALEKKLGQLTLILKHPQCFEAEFYAVDLGIDAAEDKRLNFGECMLRGLLGRWAMDAGLKHYDMDPIDVWGSGWVDTKKKKVPSFRFWDDPRARSIRLPSFDFDCFSVYVSSLKRSNEPWKLLVSEMDSRSNEEGEIPEWIVDCVLRNRIPNIREWKFSFHLLPYDVASSFLSFKSFSLGNGTAYQSKQTQRSQNTTNSKSTLKKKNRFQWRFLGGNIFKAKAGRTGATVSSSYCSIRCRS